MSRELRKQSGAIAKWIEECEFIRHLKHKAARAVAEKMHALTEIKVQPKISNLRGAKFKAFMNALA